MLSEEQKQRIEANRVKALKILESKQISDTQTKEVSTSVLNSSYSLNLSQEGEGFLQDSVESGSKENAPSTTITSYKLIDDLYCEQLKDDKMVCGAKLIQSDMILHEHFNEKCCSSCRLALYPDYEYISRGDMMTEYLISPDSIQYMKFITKHNPKNNMWKPMKLYLRKHARLKAYERYQSEEGLQAEKTRRQQVKYEKEYRHAAQVVDTLLSSSITSSSSSSSSTLINHADLKSNTVSIKESQFVKDLSLLHTDKNRQTCNESNGFILSCSNDINYTSTATLSSSSILSASDGKRSLLTQDTTANSTIPQKKSKVSKSTNKKVLAHFASTLSSTGKGGGGGGFI